MNGKTLLAGLLMIAAISAVFSAAASEGSTVIKAGVDNLPPTISGANAELSLGAKTEITSKFAVADPNGIADLAQRECVLKSPSGQVVSRAPASVRQCGEIRCPGECTLLLLQPEDGTYKVEISVADKHGEKAFASAEFEYAGAGQSAAIEAAAGNGEAPPSGLPEPSAKAAATQPLEKPWAQKNFLEMLLDAITKFFGLFR